MEIEEVLETIEKLRKEMQELVKKKRIFIDEEVVKKSRELDNLLNEYLEMLKGKD